MDDRLQIEDKINLYFDSMYESGTRKVREISIKCNYICNYTCNYDDY
jgi:hypothetical protein